MYLANSTRTKNNNRVLLHQGEDRMERPLGLGFFFATAAFPFSTRFVVMVLFSSLVNVFPDWLLKEFPVRKFSCMYPQRLAV